jgi:ABC-2 type transport system permease protein
MVQARTVLVWRIARREWVELLRDRRFFAAAAIVFLMLGGSAGLGAQRYSKGRGSFDALRTAERRRWLDQGDRNPHSAAHLGQWVFRPSDVLSAFDAGITRHVGSGVHLEAHSQRLFRHRPAEDATWLQSAGELTAAVTLQKVVPLLLILMGFASLAGERERGTLRLALSTGAPARALVAGKALGLYTVSAALLVPASLLGALALVLHTGPSDGRLVSRTAILAASYLAYFAVFVAFTLAASGRARTSRSALAALTAVWMGTVVLGPPLVLGFAARLHPTPTALEFASGIQSARAYGPVFYERLIAVERRLLAEHHARTVEELPVNATGIAMFEEERDEDALHDTHFRNLSAAYAQQERAFRLGAFLSPLVAVQSLSMALSGTSLAQHLHFAQVAEAYRRQFVQAMNDDLARNDRPGARRTVTVPGAQGPIYVRGRELWETVPEFTYEPPRLEWILRSQRLTGLALLSWCIAATAAAAASLRRMTVDPA